MNAIPDPSSPALGLVEIIELKWLLAREGHHLHVERLQCDPAYACQCLALAEASPSPALRAVAARLRGVLQGRVAGSADAVAHAGSPAAG